MRLRRLGRDDDLGSVLGGLERDGLADAAARAGDEDGLAGEFSAERRVLIKICHNNRKTELIFLTLRMPNVTFPNSDNFSSSCKVAKAGNKKCLLIQRSIL
jgi:hypothetical protein